MATPKKALTVSKLEDIISKLSPIHFYIKTKTQFNGIQPNTGEFLLLHTNDERAFKRRYHVLYNGDATSPYGDDAVYGGIWDLNRSRYDLTHFDEHFCMENTINLAHGYLTGIKKLKSKRSTLTYREVFGGGSRSTWIFYPKTDPIIDGSTRIQCLGFPLSEFITCSRANYYNSKPNKVLLEDDIKINIPFLIQRKYAYVSQPNPIELGGNLQNLCVLIDTSNISGFGYIVDGMSIVMKYNRCFYNYTLYNNVSGYGAVGECEVDLEKEPFYHEPPQISSGDYPYFKYNISCLSQEYQFLGVNGSIECTSEFKNLSNRYFAFDQPEDTTSNSVRFITKAKPIDDSVSMDLVGTPTQNIQDSLTSVWSKNQIHTTITYDKRMTTNTDYPPLPQ